MKQERTVLEPLAGENEVVAEASSSEPETIIIGADTPNPLTLHRKNMHGTYIYAPEDVEEQPEQPPQTKSLPGQLINSGIVLVQNLMQNLSFKSRL